MTAPNARQCPPESVLSDFGLGKLDANSADTISQHIETCADCRQRVAGLSGDTFVGRLRKAGDMEDGLPRPSSSLASSPVASGRREPPGDSAPGPSSISAPPELANHPDYELIKELGQGGMGTVYLAKNRMMDRPEVLKVISKSLLDRPGALERFQQEIRSAAKLGHPNIVAAYSVLRPGDSLVFAMEYVKGQDLSEVVKARGPLPVTNAAFYIHQVANGLQHAFEKGMVHRDIKPNNLMLAIEGKKHTVKILDFGLAKATSEKGAETGLTKSGQMLGTPDYVAPEQTLDAHKADIRADIYSLGCTLYFLLSGGPPFQEASLFEILQAHHTRDPRPLNLVRPEVPVELAAVVAKMMAKDPAKRYQTPLEVAKVLVPFFKPGQSVAPPPSAKPSSDTEYPQYAVETPPRPQSMTPPSFAGQPSPLPLPVAPIPVGIAPVAIASTPPDDFGVSINVQRPAIRRRSGWSSLPPWQRWAALGGAAAALLLGIVLLVRTPRGTIEIELSDPDAKVTVAVDGNRVDIAGLDKPLSLEVGEHEYTVKGDGFETVARQFAIKRGPNAVLKIKLAKLEGVRDPKDRGHEPTDKRQIASGEDGFVPLLNEADLTGCDLVGGVRTSHVSVVNGELTALNDDPKEVKYLLTDRADYADFHFRCEFFATSDKAIAAVQMRTEPMPVAGGMRGYLLNVQRLEDAAPGGASCTTTLALGAHGRDSYELAKLKHRAPGAGEWHKLAITVIGGQIKALIDGDVVIDHHDEGRTFRSGALALLFRPKARSRLRKLEIREFPRDREPKPATGFPSRWANWRAGHAMRWHDGWRVYQQAGEKRWIETNASYPNFNRHTFSEVRRTPEFIDIELPKGSGKGAVRLWSDRVEIGSDFEHLKPSVWLNDWASMGPAESPALEAMHQRPVLDKWWTDAIDPENRRARGVDLLRLIDPARDARLGKWQLIDGRLVGHARSYAQIDLPIDPPEEYVVTAFVLPTRAEDPFFLGLPIGKSQVLVTLNTENGQGAGLSLIDGRAATDNETTRPGSWLYPFECNLVECRVRKNQIQVTCNGALAIDWTGDPGRLSLPQPWKTADKPRVFIGGRSGWLNVPQMLFSPLSDAEGSAQNDTLKPADGPIDLLKRVEPARDAILGEWRRDGDALTSPSGWRTRLQIPVVAPAHYRLTAVVSREGGKKNQGGQIVFGLPVGKYHTTLILDNANRTDPLVGLELVDGKWASVGSGTRAAVPKLPEGVSTTVVCTVHPDQVSVQLDGKQVLDWHGDARRLSINRHWSPADWSKPSLGTLCGVRFSKLQLEALDSEPTAEKKRGVPAAPAADASSNAAEDFFAINAKKDDIKALASGLQYKVLKSGNGPSPTEADTVKMHYRGTLLDGTEFDNSYRRGSGASFPLNKVIKGWAEALPLMKAGDKWQLFVPSKLAYGEQGARDKDGKETIPPNAALIFDIELLEVVGKSPVGKASTDSPPLAEPISDKIRKLLNVKFLRNTLEKQLARLAGETGVEIIILADDLGAEGITKNQSFSVDEKDQPAADILRKILKLANPAGKLVYVIKPKPEGGEAIYVTTRAAADKRGDALPPELTAAPATDGDTPTASQRPKRAAELKILEARWGDGPNWVDVTQEVQAGVRDGRYLATADLDAVGNKDPRRGSMKNLIIRYSTAGLTRTETFRDGQVVYLAAEDPPPAQRPALTLLEAKYGGGNTWIDVLDKLRPLVKNNALSVKADSVARLASRPGGYYPNSLFVRYALGGRTARMAATGGDILRIDGRAVAGRRETVDLLKWIDPKRDAIRGDWAIAGGKLITAATQYSLLEVPFSPPAEYKLTLVASCQRHEHSLTIGVAAGGQQGRIMLDAWGKSKSSLEFVDGLSARNGNPTVHNGAVLRDGEPNTIVCEVRAGRISVECNGARIIDFSGDFERLSLEPGYRTRDSSHLFLGSWDTKFEISRLELLPLGAAAQRGAAKKSE